MYNEFKEKIEEVISKYNNKTAVSYLRNNGETDKISFNEIEIFMDKMIGYLGKIGLLRGDRAAVIAPHSPYAVFTGMALTYAGVTIVLIDASLPDEEINKLLNFSDVKAVFTVAQIYNKLCIDVIQNIPCFNLECGLEIVPFNPECVKCFDNPSYANSDKDVIAILYSSGTTGEMKGIMVTYESVLKAREVFVRLSGLKDYMTYLLVLPFNHIAGFTGAMTFFLTGCEIGFIEDVNASKLQNGLLKFQPYYFAMVPKVYEVMEQKIRAAIHEKGKSAETLISVLFKISKFFRKNLGINIGRKMFKNVTTQVFGKNIYGIGTGASPCKAETTEFFLNLGLEWANLYATTETSVPITATGIHDKYPVGTVGNVNHHSEIKVKILNSDNSGIGEIAVKSELMMKGYFKRPDLTEKAFDNGYFKTGDYGYIDKKGYLYITGRIKESIVLQNGKKVSPTDVDDYYFSRISDYDIASRGIANDKEQYDEIHLFIANKGYSEPQKQEIQRGFEQISRNAPSMYKLSGIHFVEEIPRTSVGKVKRFCLKVDDKNSGEKHIDHSSSKLIDIFRKHCNVSDVSLESNLIDDLGLDSLTMFEIICDIEKEFYVDISQQLNNMLKIKDIYDLIVNCNEIHNTSYPIKKTPKMVKQLHKWIKLSKIIYKVEVVGKENIPDNDDYIICSNHESNFDPLWILAAMDEKIDLNKVCCMAAKHTMEGKISKRLFEALGGIPVDREGNTIPAMNSAKRCLNDGRTIIIFPEGARSRDGSMLPFKNGAARLALDTNKKILPIEIDGAFEAFPRWIKYPHFFDLKHFKKYCIKIRICNPIEPKGLSDNELTLQIRDRISNNNSIVKCSNSTFDFVKKVIVDLIDADDVIHNNSRIKEDIGMDSLNIFELCVAIDEKYNISLESHLNDNITIDEIVNIIEQKNQSNDKSDETAKYPLKRSDKDYKSFDRFMKISKFIYNFEITEKEHLNSNENYIFCPNHESHFDGMWVIGNLDDKVKHSICSVAADYLFEKRIYRKGLIRMGGIPVHRSGNTTTALKRAFECITREGYNLLIHPEGTRTRNGELGEFKLGAAKLAIESGVKIVPVCINGAYEIFPPHRKLPRLFDWKHFRRYTLQISFGKPIDPSGKTAEDITNEIRQQIVECKDNLRRK